MSDYWQDCIQEAFEDAQLTATPKQIDTVTAWVEGAHENYGLATGLEVASHNYESDESRELKQLKAEQKRKEDWELSTQPCESCTTTGIVLDGWGRQVECHECDGKGRVPYRY